MVAGTDGCSCYGSVQSVTRSATERQDSSEGVPKQEQQHGQATTDDHIQPEEATKIVVVDGHDDPGIWKRNLDSALTDYKVTHLSMAHLHLADVSWRGLLSSSPPSNQQNEPRIWERIEMVDCGPVGQIPETLRTLLFLEDDSTRARITCDGSDCGDVTNVKTALHEGSVPSVCNRLYISFDGRVTLECGQVLAKSLSTSARLCNTSYCGMRQLTLASVQWTSPAIRALSAGLVQANTLEELNLSYCTFLDDDSHYEQFMARCSDDVIDEQVRLPLFEALANGIQHNTSIRCIRLNRCQLHDAAIATLAAAVNGHPSLQELYLGGNRCHVQGMKAISSSLVHKDSRLIKLGLSNTLQNPNDIANSVDNSSELQEHYMQRQSCLQLLFDALCENSTLEVLHLSSNYLQDSEISALSASLSSNPHSGLLMLDLKNNDISDLGIKQFCDYNNGKRSGYRDYAGIPPRLQKLWLLGNARLGPQGAQYLLHVMEASHVELVDVRIPTYIGFRPHPGMRSLQSSLRYVSRLNKGGRRLVLQNHYEGEGQVKQKSTEGKSSGMCEIPNPPSTLMLPMGVWPFVFERINRMKFGREFGRPNTDTLSGDRADVIYFLLSQSPVLWH